jgi:hypothetical protein
MVYVTHCLYKASEIYGVPAYTPEMSSGRGIQILLKQMRHREKQRSSPGFFHSHDKDIFHLLKYALGGGIVERTVNKAW